MLAEFKRQNDTAEDQLEEQRETNRIARKQPQLKTESAL
jgi:hypothetical protein